MSIINLLPEDYLTKKQRNRTNVLFFFLFAIVMVGVIFATYSSRIKYRTQLEELATVEQAYQKAAVTVNEIQNLQAKQTKLKAKNRRIIPLIDPVPKSLLLAMVTNARPKNISIISLSLNTEIPKPLRRKITRKKNSTKNKKSPPPPPPVRPNPIVKMGITGLACTDVEVAQFISNLNSSGLMKSVSLGYSEEKIIERLANMQLRKFTINCELSPKADARNLKNTEIFIYSPKQQDSGKNTGVKS